MSENHKVILEKANAAIVEGDFEGFLRFCTADTKWTFVGDRTITGKDAVRQWMATAYRAPPKFKVQHMIAEGEFVTALGEITLKDDDGESTCYAYCDVWRFCDGRMAELRAFVIETHRERCGGGDHDGLVSTGNSFSAWGKSPSS